MGKMTLKIKIVLIPQCISDVLCACSEQVTKIWFATLKKTAFGGGGWGAPVPSSQSRPVPTENIHVGIASPCSFIFT